MSFDLSYDLYSPPITFAKQEPEKEKAPNVNLVSKKLMLEKGKRISLSKFLGNLNPNYKNKMAQSKTANARENKLASKEKSVKMMDEYHWDYRRDQKED